MDLGFSLSWPSGAVTSLIAPGEVRSETSGSFLEWSLSTGSKGSNNATSHGGPSHFPVSFTSLCVCGEGVMGAKPTSRCPPELHNRPSCAGEASETFSRAPGLLSSQAKCLCVKPEAPSRQELGFACRISRAWHSKRTANSCQLHKRIEPPFILSC